MGRGMSEAELPSQPVAGLHLVECGTDLIDGQWFAIRVDGTDMFQV